MDVCGLPNMNSYFDFNQPYQMHWNALVIKIILGDFHVIFPPDHDYICFVCSLTLVRGQVSYPNFYFVRIVYFVCFVVFSFFFQHQKSYDNFI